MSILTDLRAALAAVDAARKTLALPLPISEVAYLEREEALYSALGTYHKLLTDDTIAALVAVARAVGARCEDCLSYRHPDFIDPSVQAFCRDGVGCNFADAREHLAPLVKEADDE
jgi:hypothetical protein